jgi:hypothetical protein
MFLLHCCWKFVLQFLRSCRLISVTCVSMEHIILWFHDKTLYEILKLSVSDKWLCGRYICDSSQKIVFLKTHKKGIYFVTPLLNITMKIRTVFGRNVNDFFVVCVCLVLTITAYYIRLLHGTCILTLTVSQLLHFNVPNYELTIFDSKCIHIHFIPSEYT